MNGDYGEENTLEKRENPLTGIHPPYTLSATPNESEVDRLMVKTFLDTLAEVALSVASRKVAGQ